MANANANCKFFVCATAQPSDINQAAYEALTWVEVGNVGQVGETGTKTNNLNYDTWDNDVTQKSKGMGNAGDPDVEVGRAHNDAGQIVMRTIALTNDNYAFKIERNDQTTGFTTNTILFNRGLISGPTRPQGRVEDFDLEVFTLSLNQTEIVVDPVAA